LDENVHFAVLACDGIWDCMSSQQVVDFVLRRVAVGKELSVICEEMIDYCLAPDAFVGAVGIFNVVVNSRM
jgi:protein phosphatase 2C family protein 2/3